VNAQVSHEGTRCFTHSDALDAVGLPAGVVNVVHGTAPTVNAICDHTAIKAISFVGGDRAGRHIYERQVDLSQSLSPVC
jgi:acyl-CoA reductase-like NAD-dependent aldehyde dehydrogenase